MSTIVKKEIPKVSGLPFIGNTKQLLDGPLKFYTKCYKKYGSVFKIKTISDEIIIIAGAKANQYFDKHADEFLTTGDLWVGFTKELNSDNFILKLNGKEHLEMRKVTKKGYSPMMLVGKEEEALAILDSFFNESYNKKSVKVIDFIQDITVNLLGILLADYRPTGYENDLKTLLGTLINVTLVKMWSKKKLEKPEYLQAKNRVRELVFKAIDHNKKTKSERLTPNLVDDIIESFEDGTFKYTEGNLFSMVLTPFTAGIDTVATTASTVLYKLMRNPDLKAKAKAEADDFFASGTFETKNLRKLSVMLKITLEAMRMHPIAPAIRRTALKDFEYEGFTIKKGQAVHLAQGVAHFDETIFKNPNDFDIDRYSTERGEHKTKSAWSPYGLGNHKCIGNKMGEVMSVLIISYMLHKLDFESVPKNYKLKFTTLPTPGPSRKFKARFWKL